MSFRKFFNLYPLMLFVFFTNMSIIYASETKRPSANNKVGHTSKSAEERENSIINKIINNKAYFTEDSERKRQTNQINSNEIIINQIKTLSELKRDGFLSDEEFESKKVLLLERIQ